MNRNREWIVEENYHWYWPFESKWHPYRGFDDQGGPWTLKHAFKRFRRVLRKCKGGQQNFRMRNITTGQIFTCDVLDIFGLDVQHGGSEGQPDPWWFVQNLLDK